MSDAARAKEPAKKPDPPAPVAQRAPAPEKGKGGPAADSRQALGPAIPLGGEGKTAQRAAGPEAKAPAATEAKKPEAPGPKTAQRAAAPEAKAPAATGAKSPDPTGAKTAQRAAVPGADDAVAHSPLKSGGAPAKNTILQAKMDVTAPGDHWEQEADRAADQVLSGQSTGPLTPVTPAAAQRSGSGKGPTPDATSAAESAFANRGSGSPLPAQLKEKAEQSTGTDLSGVRVHDDANAKDAASNLGARAFTVGNDIAMGPGESKSNDRLLAHEVAHTVQQGGGAGPTQRALAQRGGNAPATDTDTGTKSGDTITFEKIQVPSFKLAAHRGPLYQGHKPLKQKKNYDRDETGQRDIWKDAVAAAPGQMKTELENKISARHHLTAVDPSARYVLRGVSRHGAPTFYFGTVQEMVRELSTPNWTRTGHGRMYHVDHIVELQLANYDTDPWGNTIDNMELLEESKNTSSGSTIKAAIDHKVQNFNRATNNQHGKSVGAIKRAHTLVFNDVEAGPNQEVTPDDFYTLDQIKAGEHLAHVEVTTPDELGRTGKVRVFPSAAGGQGKEFDWAGGGGPVNVNDADERDWIKPFQISQKQFNTTATDVTNTTLGTLTLKIPENSSDWKVPTPNEETITLTRVPGALNAGYINKQAIRAKLRTLHHKKTSPIEIDDMEITPNRGIVVGGRILPSLMPLQGLQLGFRLEDGGLSLVASLSGEDFHVPPPLRIEEAGLELSLSTTQGLGLSGQVVFSIPQVGRGTILAERGRDRFALGGEFEFAPGLFDRSNVHFRYERSDAPGEEGGRWSASGSATIGAGRVPGIRSGTVTVSYENGVLEATGNVIPTIPGVQNAQLSVRYLEAEGLVIAGDLALGEIPGIRSGQLHATVRRNPEGVWAVSANGTAQPNIPGIASEMSITYDRGLFVAQVRAGFNRGMLSGELLAGATNGPVDGAGTPLPGAEPPAPGAPLRIFGGGKLTLQITPWLRGTAGVRILPNGELEVMGQIAMPSSFELFAQHGIEKSLFRTPAIDIPIFGIAFAGMRAGLFATLSGGLDASASIGPGTLEDAHIGVTYNPSHEDQTTVEGGARLHIPAQAGLRLSGRAGLGLGLPGVSVTGNIEVGARLGLEGAIDTGITVNWSPGRGLVIDAHGEFTVQPAFTFDIRGIALVEAGAFGLSVELYRQEWNLASFTFGSNLTFGVRFPIHYEEGKPFSISTDNLEFIAPPINIGDTLKGLLGQIA